MAILAGKRETRMKSSHRKKKPRTPPSRRRSTPRSPRPSDLASDPILAKVTKNILFVNVDPRIIAEHRAGFTEYTYRAGELVFDEFSKGHELLLLSGGRIRIKKHTKFGVESLLAVIHEGDFFGELSLIDGLPRSARAEAIDDCTIIGVGEQTYRALLTKSSEFNSNLLKNLAVRLRTMDQTFVLELGRNALAAKSKVDKLSLLIEASKILNSALDLDKLLGLILEVATRSILADRGTLYLLDTATNELWSKVAQGNNMVEIRLPVGKGLAGYVAKTGETVNITDAYQDPRFNPEIDRKSGYKTLNVLCMPMRSKEGVIVGVFQFLNKKDGPFGTEDESFIDALSVHASIAIENARLAREMVQNERLSAVGRMASTIIHDIKNPMGTLRMYAQVIKKKTGDSEAAQLAEEIIRQVDRFVNMTQEILDFSRGISEIHLEETNLGELMEGALGFIERDLAKKNITVARRFDYTGQCTLDIDKVTRVFYNLAGNAADAMASGGTLTVLTTLRDGGVSIEFSDTGTGIPEEIRHKVFEPFFTSGKKHGTGLGLAIVKKIIDDHHGKIELDSTVGKGTTIRLFFPFQEVPAPSNS
jgi:signal transduction histidine kinase/CRP-like cAMP-binding protein